MKLRFRSFAALFALIALSIFLVESVWASTCMPAMGVESGAMASMDGAATPADCPSAMAGSAVHGSETHHEHSDSPACPLTLAAGSCAAAVTLPAPAPENLVPSPEGAFLTISPDYTRDLLLVSTLFHPPRA